MIIGNDKKIEAYKANSTDFQCPESDPFYDGTNCIKCENDLLFNATSK